MSQEQMSGGGSRATQASTTPAPQSVSGLLSRAHRALDKVRVVHGANEQYFDNLGGKNVGSVRKSLREVFNIPGDATAMVDGKAVNDDFVLASGQNLEFVKEAGVKGYERSL